jgi:hypothetical protein
LKSWNTHALDKCLNSSLQMDKFNCLKWILNSSKTVTWSWWTKNSEDPKKIEQSLNSHKSFSCPSIMLEYHRLVS